MALVEGVADLIENGDQPVVLTPVTAEIDRQRIEDIAEDARVAEHFDTQLFKRHIDISLAKPRPAPVLQRAPFHRCRGPCRES